MSEELKKQVGGNHYKQFPIQPMLFNVANNMPWAEGEIIKYVARWRFKGKLQDLKKAHHILGFLIEFHEGRMDMAAFIKGLKDVMVEPPPPMSEVLGNPSFVSDEKFAETVAEEAKPQLVGFGVSCDLCGKQAAWYIGAVHLCNEHEVLRKTNRVAFVQLLKSKP